MHEWVKKFKLNPNFSNVKQATENSITMTHEPVERFVGHNVRPSTDIRIRKMRGIFRVKWRLFADVERVIEDIPVNQFNVQRVLKALETIVGGDLYGR